MSKRKTNPARIPKTQADVDRAYERGMDFGRQTATAIFLFTLPGKEHADKEILQRVWGEIESVSEDVISRTVTVAAIRTVL